MPPLQTFLDKTVPRILQVLGPGWARDDDGRWHNGSKDVFFGSDQTIDYALKPEIIIAVIRKQKGKPFCRKGVGWGYYYGGRWKVETWDGQSKTFRRKAEAKEWLDAA